MSLKRLSFRIFVVILSCCLLLGAAAIWKFRRPYEEKLVQLPEKRPPKQAAQFIYEQAPFYFPYKTRGVGMSNLKPFSQDFGAFGRHNSHGFRTPEYTISRPPDTFRVVILGDAVTWGMGVAMETAFPYQLSERLNAGCSGPRSEVISLGVSSHKLKENYIKLLAHAQFLNPDLVIFQISPGDVDFYDYIGIFLNQGFTDAFTKYAAREQQVLQEDSMDSKVFQDALAEIAKWSSKKSVPVSFIVFPLIDSDRAGENFSGYAPHRLPPYFSSFQSVVTRIRDAGFPTLDMLEVFKEQKTAYLSVSENNTLPNGRAHSLTAKALYNFLLQNKLFTCDRTRTRAADRTWHLEVELRKDASTKWVDYNVSFAGQANLFDKLNRLHPENPWVIAERASVYYSLGRFQDALELYDSLDQLFPAFGAPWYHMALTNAFTIRRIQFLETMIRNVPDHGLAIHFLANLYLDVQKTKEACALLNQLQNIAAYQELYEEARQKFHRNKCEALIAN